MRGHPCVCAPCPAVLSGVILRVFSPPLLWCAWRSTCPKIDKIKGTPHRFFAEQIPDLLMGSLMKEAVNPIYLIELLAAYLAVFLWGGLHPARYVVSYIDNEASRLALIKAYSSTELGNVMVRMFIHLEDSSQWKIWFGRVGSHSNPSDAPSRMQVEDLLKRGVTRDSVAWDVVIMSYEKTLHMLGRG